MERVVTINLNGNAYQLDETAYESLRAYMDRAGAALADNPDRGEIMRDLEQAIADKCARHLSSAKSVISADELNRALEEMGPVETPAKEGEAESHAQTASEAPRKRLYRIKDDAKIAGVCAGIGAYFDLDANIVRLLFVVAALFTSGFFILVYIALMFLIPSAHTSEEWAAAHGVPFNAQDVIDRAKREYGRFAENASRDWREAMRERRREWRRHMHAARYAPPAEAPPGPVTYMGRVFAGLLAFVLTIVSVALLIAFLVVLFTLFGAGGAFTFAWGEFAGVPLWLAVVLVSLIYLALSAPLSYLRRSSWAAASGRRHGGGGADGLVTLIAIFVGGAVAYEMLPEFRDVVNQIPEALAIIRDSFG